MNMRQHLCELK